jgi:hypothetical protein
LRIVHFFLHLRLHLFEILLRDRIVRLLLFIQSRHRAALEIDDGRGALAPSHSDVIARHVVRFGTGRLPVFGELGYDGQVIGDGANRCYEQEGGGQERCGVAHESSWVKKSVYPALHRVNGRPTPRWR